MLQDAIMFWIVWFVLPELCSIIAILLILKAEDKNLYLFLHTMELGRGNFKLEKKICLKLKNKKASH